MAIEDEGVVPLVNQVHGDDLLLELAGRGDVITVVVRLLVAEGAHENQRPCVNISGPTLVATKDLEGREVVALALLRITARELFQ